MMLCIRLNLRDLARHPWHATATVSGVALGLATLSVGGNFEANGRGALEAVPGMAALLVTPRRQVRAAS